MRKSSSLQETSRRTWSGMSSILEKNGPAMYGLGKSHFKQAKIQTSFQEDFEKYLFRNIYKWIYLLIYLFIIIVFFFFARSHGTKVRPTKIFMLFNWSRIQKFLSKTNTDNVFQNYPYIFLKETKKH